MLNKLAKKNILVTYNIIAIPAIIAKLRYDFFFRVLRLFFFLLFMKVAEKTGIITRATNREEVKTIINVMGRFFINSPIIPFQKAKGTNAAKVVAVDAIMGTAISPTACLAASNGLYPLSTNL